MSVEAMVDVDWSDLEAFGHHVRGEWMDAPVAAEPPWLARAAAPLDCMGGFAEYCGSPTLTWPTSDFVSCAAQARRDQQVHVRLMLDGANGHPYSVSVPLALWYEAGRVVAPALFRSRLESLGHSWTRPALGVLHAILASGAAPHLGGGLNIALATRMCWQIDGRCSAAAAAATAAAVGRVLRVEPAPVDLARWAAESEERFGGLPCGFSAAWCALEGRAGALVQIRSQAPDSAAELPLPNGFALLGIDCGARHAQAERKYAEARTAAFMGRRIITRLFASRGTPAQWNGCLAKLSVNDYVKTIRDFLPTRMKGRDFLARYGPLEGSSADGSSADGSCRVDDDVIYKIRSRTEHHIYENERVHQFAERVARAGRSEDKSVLLAAGDLMFASHWSYGQRCGLGSIETDRLVTLLRQRGPKAGVFGAKICGCGAGGTVVVLISDTEIAHESVSAAAAEYAELTGHEPRLSRGTSDGALVFGVRQASA